MNTIFMNSRKRKTFNPKRLAATSIFLKVININIKCYYLLYMNK